MKVQRQVVSVAGAFALLLIATIAFVPAVTLAQDAQVAPEITVAQLAGSWQIAVVGNTGCGQTSLLFTGTLDAGGQSTGTLIGNSGCGPSNNTQTFTISSLNANRSGTAGLSCGVDCGWNFTIQVSLNKQVINLVDITDANNYLAGTAVKQ